MRIFVLPWIWHVSLASALIGALSWTYPIGGDQVLDTAFVSTGSEGPRTMKIVFDIDGARVTGTLDDTAATRDFISLLPLTLTLEDYNGTEKISDLPRRLSTSGAPAGVDPSAGDVAYYAPWGNLAIFYKDFAYSKGLVKLGRIDSRVDAFDRPGRLQATIRRSE